MWSNNTSSCPQPAYSKPEIDSDFYEGIAVTTEDSNNRIKILSHLVPPRSGYAWEVPAGCVFRLTTPDGPQVGDLNLWNRHNPRERFWASRTRQLQSSHVSVGDRLWSSLPYLRPMCTIIKDSLKDYGVDEIGGRCHDLLGTRCDPYVNKLIADTSFDFHCHSNLTRSILPYGLCEQDVHDVLNVFQVTGLDGDGRYFMNKSPAIPGSHIEFFAEIDLLCALSTCPGGDLSAWGWGDDNAGNMTSTCRSIQIEVWKLADPTILRDWQPPRTSNYHGMHGMFIPSGEEPST